MPTSFTLTNSATPCLYGALPVRRSIVAGNWGRKSAVAFPISGWKAKSKDLTSLGGIRTHDLCVICAPPLVSYRLGHADFTAANALNSLFKYSSYQLASYYRYSYCYCGSIMQNVYMSCSAICTILGKATRLQK